MFYTSTRDGAVRVRSAEAITRGISAEGGLFVPESIPQLTLADFERLAALDYVGRAKEILALYLDDFSEAELAHCVQAAYGGEKFSDPAVAPVVQLADCHVLELWKGPTCAFKDMALQLLPQLLTVAAEKTAQGKEILILVATSGDTGKAALEGFRDVPGTKILVFYPDEGVSPMQKLQMVTQAGENVSVCAVRGNFDDTQTGVKAIFTDAAIGEALAQSGAMFSSANSINWGRLAPQIVYYVSAYCDLLQCGAITLGDKINFAVPTGNFGNILAGEYARRMGLPIARLICASNANNILTDFIKTGRYDRNRPFYTTASPSMDILVSSNLERLLHMMSGSSEQVVQWMAQLQSAGVYEVPAALLAALQDGFAGGCCDDAQTAQTIAEEFAASGYLPDTHTAVGLRVLREYRAATKDETPTVLVSTANPYKFSASVLDAVAPGHSDGADEFEMVERLRQITGAPCPAQLASLKGQAVRFDKVCEKAEMTQAVLALL